MKNLFKQISCNISYNSGRLMGQIETLLALYESKTLTTDNTVKGIQDAVSEFARVAHTLDDAEMRLIAGEDVGETQG